MNKMHNYLMALAMNSDVGTLHLSNADIPVKIVEVESDGGTRISSPMTTFKCLVVNDDRIKINAPDRYRVEIDRVIFNKPATIVIWADGTKTVVKCQDGDVYSKETGLALCIAKKALGNKGNFNDIFHEWIPEEE
jgi:hypothetical protein